MSVMIKDGRITAALNGDESELMCPRCGSQYLHHTGVTVFSRGEDRDPLVRVNVIGTSVTTEVVAAGASGNPSGRRDGLAIQFMCEQCNKSDKPQVLELTVAQHKGLTLLAWRYDELPSSKT
jgi:hypothetical protein